MPESNKTIEGARDAALWLEKHLDLLPQLRAVFRQYYSHRGRDLPWRRTEDPYEILVAELLLQKTGAKPVENVWSTLIRSWPNVESLAGASVSELEVVIRPLGLRKRAKSLHEAACAIVRETKGVIPGDVKFLESLPGVGNYTASAVLSFAYNIKAATIDANAARVYTRICGFSPKTLRQGLAFAHVIGERLVGSKTHREVNYGVLDLSAQLCKPKPFCSICPALKLCQYAQAATSAQ